MKKYWDVLVSLYVQHLQLAQASLTWSSSGDECVPKALRYSELIVGKRNVGRQRLRYKAVCKLDLKSLNVDIDEWEKLTDNRNRWHSLISKKLREREN